MVCERHTTSKLHSFEQLQQGQVQTFGFRGEALASISHVSRLTITTLPKSSETAVAYRAQYIDGKRVSEIKSVAGTPGTTITIEDLFYNSQLRRKAFKNSQRSFAEEYHRILEVVMRYAIHYPAVSFTCRKAGGGSTADLTTRPKPGATPLDAIQTVFGATLARELMHLLHEDEALQVKMDGYISNTNFHQPKSTFILFINHRLVESNCIKKAVEQSYATLVPKSAHPFVYLALELNPKNVDINVHPTKREVHFLDEEEITQVLCQQVSQLLSSASSGRSFSIPVLKPPPISLSGAPVSTPKPVPSSSQGTENFRSSSNKNANTVTRNAFGFQSSHSKAKIPEHKLIRTSHKTQTLDTYGFTPVQARGSRPNVLSSTPAPSMARTPSVHSEPRSDATINVDVDAGMKRPVEFLQPQSSSSKVPKLNLPYELPPATPESGQEQSVTVAPITDPLQQITWRKVDQVERQKCELSSISNLLAQLKDQAHPELTQLLEKHIFVGVVDYSRALIQSGTRLYLVNYQALSEDVFYEIVLSEFDNLGQIQLDVPLDIKDLIQCAVTLASEYGLEITINSEENLKHLTRILTQNAEMLNDYFQIGITADGKLTKLPLVLKGYVPPVDKLPLFVTRLALEVDYSEEQVCLESVSREIALFYQLEPPSSFDPGSNMTDEGNVNISALDNQEWKWMVEHVLFKAMRKCVVSRDRIAEFTELAELSKLYQLFERC